MAYNPYNPYYPYQPQVQQQPQQQQNSSVVSVPTIDMAYNWPVAPGNSVTFKIENTPFVCTKTKGFSPLEQPVFEQYRLVKEEPSQNTPEQAVEAPNYDSQIKELWEEINAIKGRMKWRNRHDKSADANAGEAVSE